MYAAEYDSHQGVLGLKAQFERLRAAQVKSGTEVHAQTVHVGRHIGIVYFRLVMSGPRVEAEAGQRIQQHIVALRQAERVVQVEVDEQRIAVVVTERASYFGCYTQMRVQVILESKASHGR